MDDLDKNPKPASSPPPTFGSDFNPHTNPLDTNNPYNFLNSNKDEKEKTESTNETKENQKNNFSPSVKIVQTKYSSKDDPPLVDLKITNPLTYFKNWVEKFFQNQDIDIHLRIKPFATIGLIIAFGIVGGTTFSISRYFFPHSSPILHRQVVYPGVIQKGEQGQYFLKQEDLSLWKLRPKNPNIILGNLENKQVVVTGNLTHEGHLIEVSEIIVSSEPNPNLVPDKIERLEDYSLESSSSSEVQNIENQIPKLYSGINWEVAQKKVLLFTSGKRRIEQDGVYLESVESKNYPQDFVNYYTQELSNLGFKQTLNSIDTNGLTLTYSKNDLFLTLGVKNIFSGSGDDKSIKGYKAYLEHN